MKKTILDNVILVQSDLFTPLTRTPWAGGKIVANYKNHLHPEASGTKVGESWEFSCDPKFSSRVKGQDFTFNDIFEKYPEESLSTEQVTKWGKSSHILIKLLNADEPLSVQVHPNDEDKDLKDDECGKPESWLVLDAEPGSGLYIGFDKSISKSELKSLLLDGDKAKDALKFVEVKPGDYFEIEPGVTHAIGPGVTLLEPQRIIKGQSGKTYRLWDWGRKYNEDGKRDDINGQARELHIAEGLKIIDPENHYGDGFVDQTKVDAKSFNFESIIVREFPSNPYYQTIIFDADREGSVNLSIKKGYGILIGLEGMSKVHIDGHDQVEIPKGQTAFIPAKIVTLDLNLAQDSRIALILPSGSEYKIK